MLDIAMRMIIGFGLSVGLGWLITSMTHEFLGHQARKRLERVDRGKPGVTDPDAALFGSQFLLTGAIERTLFTLLIAYQVSGAAVAMMIWLGLKTALGWGEHLKTPQGRSLALHGLFTGLVSLLFALVGGLFIRTGLG